MYLCKTYFSFKYGTFSTEEVVKAGVEAGATSLALTNINSTCDAWDFVQFCRKQRVKPILGVEIRGDGQLLYILLAANDKGFRWINEFLSEHLTEKKPFPCSAVGAPFFSQGCDGRSVASDGFVIYPLGGRAPADLLQNERIGVLPGEVGKLLKMSVTDYPDKWVIRQPVTFQNKIYYNLHRLLRAADLNTLLTKVKPEELAGERVIAVVTEAPGNGAALGGIKVCTDNAWFAARPSGTEDVYKVYAESFQGPEHLAQIQAEAQDVVSAALGDAG